MCVTIGVGIGVSVGVGLGVEVAVPVGLGVKVGTMVGGAVTVEPDSGVGEHELSVTRVARTQANIAHQSRAR